VTVTMTVGGPNNVGNVSSGSTVTGGAANGGAATNSVSGVTSTGGTVTSTGGGANTGGSVVLPSVSTSSTGSAEVGNNDIPIQQNAKSSVQQSVAPSGQGSPDATVSQTNASQVSQAAQQQAPSAKVRQRGKSGDDKNAVVSSSGTGSQSVGTPASNGTAGTPPSTTRLRRSRI